MILGGISIWSKYRHKESGRIVEVKDAELMVKTDRFWQTSIRYAPDDNPGADFAVPVDDFRRRFERVEDTPQNT